MPPPTQTQTCYNCGQEFEWSENIDFKTGKKFKINTGNGLPHNCPSAFKNKYRNTWHELIDGLSKEQIDDVKRGMPEDSKLRKYFDPECKDPLVGEKGRKDLEELRNKHFVPVVVATPVNESNKEEEIQTLFFNETTKNDTE